MEESMPLTLEQTKQLYRSLTEKILDKAASDPEWKQRLLDDPEAAMREADFPEIRQLLHPREREVVGHSGDFHGPPYCHWNCSPWTLRWWFYTYGGSIPGS